MSPTTLGMKAVGDPSLLRRIERGRSPSLRTADRVLAFIGDWELDPDSAGAPPVRAGGPGPAARPGQTNRSGAVSEDMGDERTKPATRFLRISEVQARTSLGRSTIYRWAAEDRFPAPVLLGGRVARWIEAEIEEWAEKWVEKSRGGSAPDATND
nr:AlpA family phage regulatory protein [Candidatus Palauibacter soopunensis]